jgi:hypothetical protein
MNEWIRETKKRNEGNKAETYKLINAVKMGEQKRTHK